MAVRLTTQPAQPVSTAIVLPSEVPLLPDEMVTRFPSAKDYQDQMQAWWKKVRANLASSTDDLATANNTSKATEKTLATQITTLSAGFTDDVAEVMAAITTETTARTNADGALATQINTVQAGYKAADTSIISSIAVETTARTNADGALATQITTLTTAYQGADTTLQANITAEISARTNADSALATRATTLESQVQTAGTGLLSRMSTVETTYATQTFAETKKTEAITAAVSTANTNALGYVSSEATARATADGFLSGKWTLQVGAGNVVSGMNLSASTGPGGNISTFIVSAGVFQIYNTATTTGVAPFEVSGGQVRVAGGITIGASQVGGLAATATSSDFSAVTGATKPANNADVTLAAINGGLTITSGGITLAGSPSIKSSDYVSGVAGWTIKGDGTVEFLDGLFRGTLDIGAGHNKVLISGNGLKVGQNNLFSVSAPSDTGDFTQQITQWLGTDGGYIRAKTSVVSDPYLEFHSGLEGTGGSILANGHATFTRINSHQVTEGGLEVNAYGSGDRYSGFDFHSDDTNSDYSTRILRNPGVNGSLEIVNSGSGRINISAPGGLWVNGTFVA